MSIGTESQALNIAPLAEREKTPGPAARFARRNKLWACPGLAVAGAASTLNTDWLRRPSPPNRGGRSARNGAGRSATAPEMRRRHAPKANNRNKRDRRDEKTRRKKRGQGARGRGESTRVPPKAFFSPLNARANAERKGTKDKKEEREKKKEEREKRKEERKKRKEKRIGRKRTVGTRRSAGTPRLLRGRPKRQAPGKKTPPQGGAPSPQKPPRRQRRATGSDQFLPKSAAPMISLAARSIPSIAKSAK